MDSAPIFSGFDAPSPVNGIAPSTSSTLDLSGVQTVVKAPPPEFPLGPRGDRSLWVKLPFALMGPAQTIPGVIGCAAGGVLASWHAVPALRREFPSLRLPDPPVNASVPLRGLADYTRLKLGDRARPFQPSMIEFLVRRSEALNGEPLRGGKCFEDIAASIAIGARKILVISPALVKLVWASEIAKWAQEAPLLLYGRGGTEARWFCLPCNGSGLLKDGTEACPHCRARNGSSYGDRIVQPEAALKHFLQPKDPGLLTDTATLDAQMLKEQRRTVADALDRARWVVTNYDCLIRQEGSEKSGKAKDFSHLPGWVEMLTRYPWEVVILDEAQAMAGRGTKERRGKSKRDRVVQLCEMVPRLWPTTGTPFYGSASDGWGVMDAMTNGGFGSPQQWDVRYAGAEVVPPVLKDGVQIVPAHWECRGETRPDELRERLAVAVLKRERKDIVADMPPKTRIVQRVEAETPPRLSRRGGLVTALAQTCKIKLPFIVSQVLDEVAQGLKVIVFTWARDHAKAYEAEIRKLAEQKIRVSRMRAVGFQSWLITGDVSPDARKRMADKFVDHRGGGVVVATMDSVPGGISFNGAAIEHYAELHWNPTILEQTEDRAYEIGSTGLSIVYWVLKNSVDERVVAKILPKMKMKETLEGSTAGKDFQAAFEGPKQTADEIMQEIWESTLAALPTVVEDNGD